eukprot:scaffold64191_cov72-Cyclotella_meneghiniana.AAC.2
MEEGTTNNPHPSSSSSHWDNNDDNAPSYYLHPSNANAPILSSIEGCYNHSFVAMPSNGQMMTSNFTNDGHYATKGAVVSTIP